MWDSHFLPAKTFHKIRIIFCISSKKNSYAQRLLIYPAQDYTPLLQRSEGKRKGNILLCTSVFQRTIFSACDCISRSRARIKTQAYPDRIQLFCPFKATLGNSSFVVRFFSLRDRIKTIKREG